MTFGEGDKIQNWDNFKPSKFFVIRKLQVYIKYTQITHIGSENGQKDTKFGYLYENYQDKPNQLTLLGINILPSEKNKKRTQKHNFKTILPAKT